MVSRGCKLVFVTGTDTGVGKTLLTALLLEHLQRMANPVIALKPFCAGDRADAILLCRLQSGDLSLEQINPFFFSEPLAPLVAARKHRRQISLSSVLAFLQQQASRITATTQTTRPHSMPTILIEGCGGLLAPLGPGYSLLEIIIRTVRWARKQQVRSSVSIIIVARNKLGTLNHTLSTVRILHYAQVQELKIVLMDQSVRDFSHHSNPLALRQLLKQTPILCLPFLGRNPLRRLELKKNAKRFQKTLARISD